MGRIENGKFISEEEIQRREFQKQFLKSLHHGNFVDDSAAATGGVPVGGCYFNTTNNKLHTRMS